MSYHLPAIYPASNFCHDIASICLYSGFNPIEDRDKWLIKFMDRSEVEDRVEWTQSMERFLESMSAEDKEKQWKLWIKKYWERRLAGKPPIDQREICHLIGWAFHLEPVFEEAADLVIKGPPMPQGDLQIFYDLSEHDRVSLYPAKPLAQLLAFLLCNYKDQFWHCDYVKKTFDYLLQNGASHDVLRDMCNSLARLGCSNAMNLAESLDQGEV